MIRPGAINHPYKEVVSAVILLLILYTNYFIFLPRIFYRNHHLRYILVSLLLVCLSGLAELWLVESDISLCVKSAFPENLYTKYIYTVLLLIIFRNGGFYLFFTMLGLYRYTKKNAFTEKKAIMQKEGVASFLRCNRANIVLDISKIIYFQQEKNRTIIHTNSGKSYSIYSSLRDIEKYMGVRCFRISRETLVNYECITSYSHDYLVVKNSKSGGTKSLYFFKNNPSSVYTLLQKKLPQLEQKNETIAPKNDAFGRVILQKNDEKIKNGRENILILEEIRKKGGIHVHQLAEIFKEQFSLRTLGRRLKELKDSGKIEFRGSDRTGGYFAK